MTLFRKPAMDASLRPYTEPVSTLQLRRMLEQALRTDSQLEAFCIDYFPKVYGQLGGGMDRTQKLNLLLHCAPRAELLHCLRSHTAEVLENQLSATYMSGPSVPAPKHPVQGKISVLGSLGICGALVAVFGLARSWEPEPAALVQTARPQPRAPSAVERASPESISWLTSNPSGALVVDAVTGRQLGQTPWTPTPLALSGPGPGGRLRVCLRRAGFIPVLVRLGTETEPELPKHVSLHRMLSSVEQRELGHEECDAPIPIIP